MDVVTIEKTNEHFRIMFDVKGRFILRSITAEEAKTKLCKIKRREVGPNKVPYVVTNDGRTLRYPHPDIKVIYFLILFMFLSRHRFLDATKLYCIISLITIYKTS
jgi:ribosomal protein S4E